MSIDYVIQHAAPTLAGIKTGNLFPCTFASTQDMVRDLREINRVLVPRGLRLLPLRRKDDRALLYLFRPADLSRDLAGQEARRLLREAGFETAALFGERTFAPPSETEQRWVFVARKGRNE